MALLISSIAEEIRIVILTSLAGLGFKIGYLLKEHHARLYGYVHGYG